MLVYKLCRCVPVVDSLRFASLIDLNYSLQYLDLTDLDFSPDLWVACQDEDDRNRKSALSIWEENALEVPESFVSSVLVYLGEWGIGQAG